MTESALGRLVVPVHVGDHSLGPNDGDVGAVTLVEYADFQCPESAAVAPVLRSLRRQLSGQLRRVFRHFPLTHKHPHAQWAAEVAEAAAAQGKFWEMHDQLFVHQNLLGDAHLDLYAARIGLDLERVRHELAVGLHTPRVSADRDGGVRSGVTGTPTFFVGEALYDGEYDTASLLAAVHAAGRTRAGPTHLSPISTPASSE